MHIVHDTEYVSPSARGPGLIARAVAAFLGWQLRDMERRLLLNRNGWPREDGGLGPAAPRGSES